MKCVNCKHCVQFVENYYWCNIEGEITSIEECVANDDNMPCDLYVPELDADDSKA